MAINNVRYVLFPVPFALLWMILTNEVGIISFLIGYLLAFSMGLLLVGSDTEQQSVTLNDIAGRLLALLRYILRLSVDILLSGIDVALRVIGLRSVARTGIIAVPIQDDEQRDVIAGLSAHAITITPGELVVTYDEDGGIMYVHALDVEASEQDCQTKQAERVAIYRRILGHD